MGQRRKTRWQKGLLWVRHRVEYVLFRLLLCVWQILPPRGCERLARGLATLICCLPEKLNRTAVVRKNLQRITGDRLQESQVAELRFAMWVHLFRILGEVALLSRKMRRTTTHDIVTFRQREDLRDVVRTLMGNRPVIFASGHFGNWELAISIFGQYGFPMGVVARELDNPLLQDWFARFRQATGHTLIAKHDCFDEIREVMERKGCLALLCDQDAGRGGVFVDFFGAPASTLKTIAMLALEYDAVICVGGAHRLPVRGEYWEQFQLALEELIDPRELTSDDPVREISQRFTSALERIVSRAPEQYFWLHKRWKTRPGDREARRLARKKAA